MPVRLVALDEGSDIPLDRAMVVVGRHPQCDARLDSLRVSRHHCCMTIDHGEVIVRDLGSTNGIRINGQRVELGRVRPGDLLSIAHIRYRLENGQGHEPTLVDKPRAGSHDPLAAGASPHWMNELGGGAGMAALGVHEPSPLPEEERVAAALRDAIPSAIAERYRIQVIVQGPHPAAVAVSPANLKMNGSAALAAPDEEVNECRPDSSH